MKRGGLFPQPLAFDRCLVGEGKMTGVECERPAIVGRQPAKALHRRPVQALGNHLVQGKDAALARAFHRGEGDRRGVEFRGRGAVAVSGLAMTRRRSSL